MSDPSNNLHKKRTASEFLIGPEEIGVESTDEGEDKGDEEGGGDDSSGLEERDQEVKDKVDIRPLPHHLERSTKDGATEVTASLQKGAREALEPAGPVASSGDHLSFVLGIGDDLSELRGNVVRDLGLTTRCALCLAGLSLQRNEGIQGASKGQYQGSDPKRIEC